MVFSTGLNFRCQLQLQRPLAGDATVALQQFSCSIIFPPQVLEDTNRKYLLFNPNSHGLYDISVFTRTTENPSTERSENCIIETPEYHCTALRSGGVLAPPSRLGAKWAAPNNRCTTIHIVNKTISTPCPMSKKRTEYATVCVKRCTIYLSKTLELQPRQTAKTSETK